MVVLFPAEDKGERLAILLIKGIYTHTCITAKLPSRTSALANLEIYIFLVLYIREKSVLDYLIIVIVCPALCFRLLRAEIIA